MCVCCVNVIFAKNKYILQLVFGILRVAPSRCCTHTVIVGRGKGAAGEKVGRLGCSF